MLVFPGYVEVFCLSPTVVGSNEILDDFRQVVLLGQFQSVRYMSDDEHPGEEPDNESFTYPGPNPFSKEQAILMMADSVEAASRSLPEYTEESISNLVDKIIDSQVEEGYFRECPVTFKDIATVKAVFKEKLKTIYHTRISYPELKKQDL